MVSNIDIDNVNSKLHDLSDDARLWIFQSDKKLSDDDVQMIQEHLNKFLSRWTSHNRSLKSCGTVAFDHFVIIALDESQSHEASGCSIDAMTHKIQGIANSLNLNLMDRSIFYFYIDEKVIGHPMTQVAEEYKKGLLTDGTLVFNNLIKAKSDLHSGWIVPLGHSWHKRFA